MPDGSQTSSRATSWLSKGLETLVRELAARPQGGAYDFDVVIVGSGYGGAVAAAELSACVDAQGHPLRICVLERGKEYLAGSFPSEQANLAGYVRFADSDSDRARGVADGLYDIRMSKDAMVVAASGLGGGSLINAGVMEMPKDYIFQEARWPAAIRADTALIARLANELRVRLGAKKIDPKPIKTKVLRTLAGENRYKRTRVTVAFEDGPNDAGVELDACIRCGDCATGCNHNAKNSLDLNLLRTARDAGVQFFTGATVLRVKRDAGGTGWVLSLVHTDKQLRDREKTFFPVRARKVVFAAGTLGSTEILKRSISPALKFSGELGKKFSANGDMIAIGYDTERRVNAVADETHDPAGGARRIGPTITAMVDLRKGDPKTDVVIQDLAVPGPLRRLFEESTTTAALIDQLSEGDCTRHKHDPARPDDAAVNPKAIGRSLVVAMIARDDATGVLDSKPLGDSADGILTVTWPELRLDPRLAAQHTNLATMLKESGLMGRVVGNMVWRPFSEKLETFFGKQRGPLVTVHPLGGCAMGDDVNCGVVDNFGRVFDANGSSPTSVHEGLVVLDGSIVPTSLGINPALTISLLALRAVRSLKQAWGLTERSRSRGATVRRPIFAETVTRTNPTPTRIEITEQMRGWLNLVKPDHSVDRHMAELTLITRPVKIAGLMKYLTPQGRRLPLLKGRLRILKSWTEFDSVTDATYESSLPTGPNDVELIAEISGRLRIFSRGSSNPVFRTVRALAAWFLNRGLRDICQGSSGVKPAHWWGYPLKWWNYLCSIIRLCSRAGAVRLIEYDLQIGEVLYLDSGSKFSADLFEGKSIQGAKRLTYALADSPYKQLMTLPLLEFPQMARGWSPGGPAALKLNERYLARQAVPLLRVVKQQNRVTALGDLLSFFLYSFRITIQSHALSFRKPDPPSARTPDRFPAVLDKAPKPTVDWLIVDAAAHPPVKICLTRYDARAAGGAGNGVLQRPVLLIHGYSASGSTYAHPAVPGNLVEMLCGASRDVWVVEMRSSAAMDTATGNWSFETMATEDIPAAINHVLRATQAPKVDIVAHCMGAAMFSMAILNKGAEHRDLSRKIGRAVFSQIGPVMILSAANIFRAYVMRYARQFLQLDGYTFSPQGEISLAGQLLDRALAALPVPVDEYRRENPIWPPGKRTPWVGTRHRMDALYARTFSLSNLSDGVLDYIDDFFGPLSIETVSQVIHFAGFNTVTDRKGVNRYVVPMRIYNRFKFPMMSIHGEDNGLSNVATLALMRDVLFEADIEHLNQSDGGLGDPTARAQSRKEIEHVIDTRKDDIGKGGPSYLTWRIAGHGHQDCLIGKDAATICGVIAKYLSIPDTP